MVKKIQRIGVDVVPPEQLAQRFQRRIGDVARDQADDDVGRGDE